MSRGGAVCPTRQREEVLALAGRTPQSGEAVVQASAVEEGLDRTGDHRAERSGAGLVALFVDVAVGVEVLVEEAVEGGAFGVAGAVDGGAVAEEEGAEREASEAGGGGRRVGEQRGCENAVHGASIEALWRCPSQRCARG